MAGCVEGGWSEALLQLQMGRPKLCVQHFIKSSSRDFPGGPVVKTLIGTQVQSLVRELDPTCMPQLRVCMPQLRSLPAAAKTRCNQINK